MRPLNRRRLHARGRVEVSVRSRMPMRPFESKLGFPTFSVGSR